MNKADWDGVQTQLAELLKDYVDKEIARSGCAVKRGTVKTASPLTVILDGEATAAPTLAMGGTYAAAQRVAVLTCRTTRYAIGALR